MYKILLVGAGQIGSRYLQGLAKSRYSYNITIIDPSIESLTNAKRRWEEVYDNSNSKTILSFQSDLEVSIKEYDIAIISTSAKERKNVIKRINSICSVKYWIIEKIVAQNIEDIEETRIITTASFGAWVNTPRRIMSDYKKLKNEIEINHPVKCVIRGGNWGIACNSIHFIDTIQWLINKKLVSIDTTYLNKKWIKSKRDGYYDILGKIIALYEDGSELIMESKIDNSSIIIDIENNNNKWRIEESNNIIIKNNKSNEFKIKYQSELTSGLVEMMIDEGKCELPTITASVEIHKILISALLNHWNTNMNEKVSKLPIT